MTLAATAFAVAMTGAAHAATVTVMSGRLLINQGQGYSVIPRAIEAGPGDTVMAIDGGSGHITYEDGCHQTVEIGNVIAIGQTSPCALYGTAITDYSLITGTIVVGAGVALAIGLSSKDDKPVSK